MPVERVRHMLLRRTDYSTYYFNSAVGTRLKHLHFSTVGGPYIETIERCPTPLAGNLATAGAVPVPPIARHLEEGALPKGASARSQPERLPPQGGHSFARLLRRRSIIVLLVRRVLAWILFRRILPSARLLL